MSFPEEFDLAEAFKRYFEIVPAFSDSLKDEVFRVRHQVFCEELAFEPRRADRRESDEHDAHSIHVLIRSIRTGAFVGCTRIILARSDDPLYRLPFEKICATALDRSMVDPDNLPRDTICEVSRLAVIAQFRRRTGEESSPLALSDNADNAFGTTTQPRFPYIPVSLYLAANELARLNGIRTGFVLTEARLARHFRTLGFAPQTVGAAVEHHGKRIPSMMSPTTIVENLKAPLRALYRTVAAQIAK